MSRPLRFRLDVPDALDDAALREAWTLRVGLLSLRVSPERDWERFVEALAGEDARLVRFFDPQGALRGFFSIRFLPVEHLGRRALLMYSKYFYFEREYRGHPKTLVAPWFLLPPALQRYGLRPLYFVTTAFPQSYVSLSRSVGELRSLRDPHTSDWEREALRAFAIATYPSDFEPSAGVVAGQNVADAPALGDTDAVRALMLRYETLNPSWREGKTLPCIFSVDARLVRASLVRVARRVTRSRRANAAATTCVGSVGSPSR